MIRNFGGVTGVTNQPTGLDIGVGGGSNVKSIQRGVTTFSAITTNATIASIDLTKSIVKISFVPLNSNGQFGIVKAKLTSSTNLELKQIAFTQATVVYWEVIEFNNVKSLQTGMISLTATTNTVTIAAVNTSKCIVFCSWDSNDVSGANIKQGHCSYGLTSSTVLTVNQSDTVLHEIEWQVIEFN